MSRFTGQVLKRLEVLYDEWIKLCAAFTLDWVVTDKPQTQDEKYQQESLGERRIDQFPAVDRGKGGTTNALMLDIAFHHNPMKELRDENDSVLGTIASQCYEKRSLVHVQKFDSVLKDGWRLYSMLLASGGCRCQADMHLGTGLLLPDGTHIKIKSFAECSGKQL
ncbi:hypothetical protein EJ05DRAFT_500292 [Pseudovirgaria hyperparasitica]|uniref:Uncharacterized protein n=1 Tax=Pseudovirgaria hyperparasitica TaxID=470096 RepID=A0A6A6W804_9PEZI|nr:uncharacterized protein EJ05DRAFT_500292 [Pseudovirgaria hyperparasitica]KAF2758773.1 hypothetical protein EJ05DRAFT_500292 [Pseudovirgaria hyperparasitica]